MPVPFCDLDRPDPLTTNGPTVALDLLRRQQWAYIVGALKGVDWYAYGLPGWDVAFTGTFPEFSRATFTEEGATGRQIIMDFTYTSGVLTGLDVQFDDADGGGLQPLLSPGQDILAADRIAAAPKYDYKRPHQIYTIEGTDRDSFAIRENLLALTCIAMCEKDDPQDYNFPGMTFTPVTRADGKLLNMHMAVTGWTLEIDIFFTHYDDEDFDLPTPEALIRTIEVRVKRFTGESFYTLGKWLYSRRGNGAVSRITELATG